MTNFWIENKIPLYSLAPMEDVTDTIFRELVLRLSSPDKLHIVFTEFCNVEGLNHPVGRERVGERLIVSASERKLLKEKGVKLVAQIWGKTPEIFNRISTWITKNYEFDGLDINMGCPVKKIVKQGACSALINQPDLAREIIQATKEGTSLPVSVKTRTGLSSHQTQEWIGRLLESDPAAIILHGRTQSMQSDGEANWEEIARAVQIRNESGKDIPIHGNGDVFSMEIAKQRIEQTGVNGVMVGRGIFYNPWMFNPEMKIISKEERITQLLFHTRLFEKMWAGQKNFNILKRFYKIYLNNFPGAAQIRAALMETKSYDEVYCYFTDFSNI
ncbi:MAG: tRNA-dihydrouridine synthase family protein [Mariniphaga sp.]|nr:tRNA-dihydrouridine synthase family protein [Mariniphaga sp.]